MTVKELQQAIDDLPVNKTVYCVKWHDSTTNSWMFAQAHGLDRLFEDEETVEQIVKKTCLSLQLPFKNYKIVKIQK